MGGWSNPPDRPPNALRARQEPALDLHPSVSDRLAALAALRDAWPVPPDEPADDPAARRRRQHAAWANAGVEGNPVTWPSACALFDGDRPADGGVADAELRGCLAAVDFLDSEPDAFALPWRPGLIRHVHGLLLAPGTGVAGGGDYRAHPVQIVRESGPERGRVVFAPPHPARVPALMESLLDGLDPGADPFLQAAVFHYEFQSIHPFADGNGRLGRLLSTALARRGWAGRGFYVAPAVKRAGAGYYLALRAVRPDYQSEPRNGLRPWVVPFLGMLEDALRHPEPPPGTDARSSA